METQTKLPRNKPMIIAGLLFYILFAVFAVLKSHLPNTGGDWSNSPFFDDVFMLGFGICWTVLCSGYTYYAWTLNPNDFEAWVKNQVLMPKKQRQKTVSDFARAYNQWLFRIISPVGALFGTAMIGFMVFAITRYLLK